MVVDLLSLISGLHFSLDRDNWVQNLSKDGIFSMSPITPRILDLLFLTEF